MSDTPKTDKEIERISSQFDGEADNIEYAMDQMGALARALERELASAKAENATLKAERDEARRDACAFEAIVRWNEAHPKGIMSPCAVERISREIAVDRGWDCFKEGGGA